MNADETILALSTARGAAARAVVRLSGAEAIPAVASLFTPEQGHGFWRETYTVTPGHLRLRKDGLNVPVKVYVMRSPGSYTCEDVSELHLPGSPALVEMVLDELLEDDAIRPAEPGEFTRRAFTNGRLDLSRAEAVMAVIHARSEAELLSANARLQGGVDRRVTVLQDEIAELRALLEVSLDFAGEDIAVFPREDAEDRLARVLASLQNAADRGRERVADRGAYHVVICGPPNAGKSSLMNRLCGAERAIVHPRAGTTRDTVSADVTWGGVRLHLSDTAGLMADATGPDESAVAAARRRIRAAHLLLLVVDLSQPWPPEVEEVAEMTGRGRLTCVLNKCDLPPGFAEVHVAEALPGVNALRTSARTGRGVAELRRHLLDTIREGKVEAGQGCLFNVRQVRALRKAEQELAQAQEAVRGGLGYEFAALNLRLANEELGQVTGQVTPQDVLDRIFSNFCIGK